MVSGSTMIPLVPFVLGLGAIFMSAGNVMNMAVGDILVFASGVAFIKVLK